MTIDERNLLIDKAKTRRDGVYSYQQYKYAVKNKGMIAFSDYQGNIFTCHGAFNYVAGKVERWDISKTLKRLIRQPN